MILNNINIPYLPDLDWIEFNDGKITNSGSRINFDFSGRHISIINFENAIAFPGLVNSHDHLEFNLFPKLGNKKYKDYVEWGEDIHKVNLDIIEEIKKIPIDLRLNYGIYKNLLCGITTVVHHGKISGLKNPLINVIIDYNYLHSVRLGKNWKLKLNNIFNYKPVLIHIGEGINEISSKEIDKLIRWNLLTKKLIGIHAIKMSERQSGFFKGIIWCPDSNYFLYGESLQVKQMSDNCTILFGTDSAVSSDWNLWNQLRFARSLGQIDDEQLYLSLTNTATEFWHISEKKFPEKGSPADIVIAKCEIGNDITDAFFKINPDNILIIFKKGNLLLCDLSLRDDFDELNIDWNDYSAIEINGKQKFVKGRLDDLCDEIKSYSSRVNLPFNYQQKNWK